MRYNGTENARKTRAISTTRRGCSWENSNRVDRKNVRTLAAVCCFLLSLSEPMRPPSSAGIFTHTGEREREKGRDAVRACCYYFYFRRFYSFRCAHSVFFFSVSILSFVLIRISFYSQLAWTSSNLRGNLMQRTLRSIRDPHDSHSSLGRCWCVREALNPIARARALVVSSSSLQFLCYTTVIIVRRSSTWRQKEKEINEE